MILGFLLACTPEPAVQPPPVPVTEPRPEPIDPDAVQLDVLHTDTLAALEKGGFALKDLVDLPRLKTTWSAEIDGLVDPMERDLVRTHEEARKWPASNVGRRFDTRWLAEDSTGFFQLVGVVNRVDRTDFTGSCEVRFLYRLAYRGDHGSSRLPFVVNVVAKTPERYPGCLERWVEGPDLDGLEVTQIELNAQIVRWPSGLETRFAGQAVYLLAVYGPGGSKRPLENTPAVARLQAEPALKAELAAWIADHLDAIDTGVFQIPEKYLATTALSWSTLGIHRRANKPFDILFPQGEGLPETERPTFATRRGLVERLNNRTCMGCHQTASTAGFHFLGDDDPDLAGITNRLQFPMSPFAQRERPRRRAWLAGDQSRPHALMSASAGINQSCTLTDDLQSVPCESGLTCEEVVENPGLSVPFGQCIATEPSGWFAGQTCRVGTLTEAPPATNEPFAQHAYADRFDEHQRFGLPEDKRFSSTDFNCRPTRIGVPLGRLYRSCTSEERRLEAVGDSICAVVGGSRFDQCVEGNFHDCLSGAIGRGMVDRCTPDRSCREDYICQRLPWQHESVPTDRGRALSEAGTGFCTPTYFVFQLRLDGHPVPTP